MNVDGKWRFTSPTHTVLAFAKAMEELEAEGGIPARSRRYADNNRLLIEKNGGDGIRTVYQKQVSGTNHHHISLS